MLQFYLQMIETEEDRSKMVMIYEDYRQIMYRAAYSVLRHREDAEDAVSCAYEHIARRIQSVDVSIKEKLRSYLVTIATNAALDIVRKRKLRLERETTETEIGVVYTYDGDDELASCLSQLKPRYREALLLKHYYGYTLKEIAEMKKITQVNAANLVLRARKRMEELYGKEYDQ